MYLCLLFAAVTAADAQSSWECYVDPCISDPSITVTPFAKSMYPYIDTVKCATVDVYGKIIQGNCGGNYIREIRIDSIIISKSCLSSTDLIEIYKQIQRMILSYYYIQFFGIDEIPPGGTIGISFISPCCFLMHPQYYNQNKNMFRMCFIDGCCKIHYIMSRNLNSPSNYNVDYVTVDSECPDCNSGGYSPGDCTFMCNAHFNQNENLEVRRSKEWCMDIPPLPKVNNIEETYPQTTTPEKIINVFPQPAGNELNVSLFIQNEGLANIVIYNELGKSIINTNYQLSLGNNNIKIDLINCNKGIYFITVSIGEMSIYQRKFIKF